MKKKIFKLLLICVFELTFAFAGCSQAKTTTNNIQKQADEFKVYRKMTFVNLYTGQLLYSAEGYFSVQTTVNNDYQGQQELALIFKIAPDEYKDGLFFNRGKRLLCYRTNGEYAHRSLLLGHRLVYRFTEQ